MSFRTYFSLKRCMIPLVISTTGLPEKKGILLWKDVSGLLLDLPPSLASDDTVGGLALEDAQWLDSSTDDVKLPGPFIESCLFSTFFPLWPLPSDFSPLTLSRPNESSSVRSGEVNSLIVSLHGSFASGSVGFVVSDPGWLWWVIWFPVWWTFSFPFAPARARA